MTVHWFGYSDVGHILKIPSYIQKHDFWGDLRQSSLVKQNKAHKWAKSDDVDRFAGGLRDRKYHDTGMKTTKHLQGCVNLSPAES